MWTWVGDASKHIGERDIDTGYSRNHSAGGAANIYNKREQIPRKVSQWNMLELDAYAADHCKPSWQEDDRAFFAASASKCTAHVTDAGKYKLSTLLRAAANEAAKSPGCTAQALSASHIGALCAWNTGVWNADWV